MSNKIYIDTNIFIDLLIDETYFDEYKKISLDLDDYNPTKGNPCLQD